MPLKKGSSKKTISSNIKELYHANEGKSNPRPRKQIIAIAESEARQTKPKKK